VLDGGSDPSWEGAILRGKGQLIVKYRENCPYAVAMRRFVKLLGPLV